LSSNKFLINFIFFLLTFSFFRCGDKGDDVVPRIDYENKVQMMDFSKNTLGDEVVSAFGGFFDNSPRKKIAAIMETDENINWGLKFVLLEELDGKLKINFQSKIIPGSHKESFLDKIKFPSFDYELLYYNSQGYFVGSGGGEVYAYIVDFENKEIYSAHLIAETNRPVSLFISKNTENREIKNFFMQIFKNEYPSLKIIDEDITLE
jgi:hypothetical protein